MKQVFVSYSRNNLEVVTQLIQDLQASGIDSWYDQTLSGGQRWWDNILLNIRERDFFIFALSPESLESVACKCELSYVMKLGKQIFPILVADGININLLPPPLNEFQVTDYRRGNKEALLSLIKSIYMAPAAPPLPDPLPTPPPVPVSYLSNLKERIDSTEPLTSQNQITLYFELEEDLREGRSPAEIRDLLLRLKRRDDLLAKISTKIDALLNSIEEKQPFQQREEAKPVAHLFNQSQPDLRADQYRPAPQPFSTTSPPARSAGKTRRYACSSRDTNAVVADVKNWLNGQGFDTQQLNTENNSLLLQIKKRGGWRDFVGMSMSLNLVFQQNAETLTVQIGAGKWIDKAAVGTVSLLILWPLAITAGLGAWEQMKMPEKIFDYIGSRLVCK